MVKLFLLLLLYVFVMHSSLQVKIHGKVTVGPKSQIVIPKDVRALVGIKPGDDLLLITKGDMAIAMVKSDDVQKFLEYIKAEMEA